MVPVELEQWQHLYKKNQEKDHMIFVKIMPELKQREVTPLFDTAYEKKWKLLFSSFQYKKNELIEKMKKRK